MLSGRDNYEKSNANVEKKNNYERNKTTHTKNAQGLTNTEIDYVTKSVSLAKVVSKDLVPKLLKSKTIQGEVKQKSDYILAGHPDGLKFRPIAAGCNCPTNRLSNFMDKILNPLIHHINIISETLKGSTEYPR